jgi:hypothetical protein
MWFRSLSSFLKATSATKAAKWWLGGALVAWLAFIGHRVHDVRARVSELIECREWGRSVLCDTQLEHGLYCDGGRRRIDDLLKSDGTAADTVM